MAVSEVIACRFITSNMPTFKYNSHLSTVRQRGMAVLAIVAILLSVVTFVTITTSQNVQQFFTIHKSRQDTMSSHSTMKQQVKDVAMALQTQNVSTALNTTSSPLLSTTIHKENLVGVEQQPLIHYEVTVSHNAENIQYKASFLRYPSLLRLPTAAQQFSWDNQLTHWLFNRNEAELSAAFFPNSVAATHCHNLAHATIYWINGDCELTSGDLTHTSSSTPILLMVVDGDLTISANAHFFGLIVMLSTTSSSYELNLASSSSITGAYVSNTPLQSHISGAVTPTIGLLRTLQASTYMAKIIPIPGTWYDAN